MRFARSLLTHMPKSRVGWSPRFRKVFARPDPEAISKAWNEVRDHLASSFPKVGPLMDEGKAEVLTFTGFPKAHCRKI